MDLVCIGVNHKLCPVQIREQLAFSESDLPFALAQLRQIDGLRECFLLSTCNRVEVYGHAVVEVEPSLIDFLSDFHGVDKDLFEPYLYRHRGREVIRHLFRVSGGLDSLVIGENEIYGQVRSAFRLANRIKTLDSVLYQVVERAIRVGKRVRSETKINDRSVSVSSIAVDLAEKIFGRLTEEQILVLGTGKMSDKTMKHLVASGARSITVASRTYERALETAQRFGARPIGFDEWFRALQASDIVISSTAAPQPIIHVDDVKRIMNQRRHKPLCFIDIAVPRDIDPRVAEIDDVYLYDIDDLKSVSEANLRLRKKEVEHCEAIIAREVDSFDQWYEYLQARPVVEKLNAYFDEVVEQELQKARHQFKGKEKELDALVRKMKASFLHVPLEQLKERAQSGSIERYLEALHTLFQLGGRRTVHSKEGRTVKSEASSS
ncbi:MAG: glutamyl-tRNA reductase [Omnitrophica bacterium RIFCSPLOWO2_12_FULL_50_11]|nr:MAG: glutamyl-tRNA reductase [Omnitrophica bacterium RIFCSPLOWO2_12_FULL_50_11]